LSHSVYIFPALCILDSYYSRPFDPNAKKVEKGQKLRLERCQLAEEEKLRRCRYLVMGDIPRLTEDSGTQLKYG